MIWKQPSQSSDESGFTILELLVASTIGLGVLAMALSSTLASRNLFRLDAVRTRINQDLRGTMDIIGADIRLGGENFNSSFPAILVTNGTSGGPDELVIRRNLLDEVLKVCEEVNPGSGNDIFFATGSGSGCIYSDNTYNYQSWMAYRQANNYSTPAYIFSSSTKLGDWITYAGETDGTTEYSIQKSGSVSNTYDINSSAVYMMEEWRFRLVNDTIQLLVDGDTATPYNVAFGITDFQVRAIMSDGTALDTFDATQNWTQLGAIELTLTGQDTYRGEVIERSLTARFFPRNILSN